ncbi:MAG TPA: hypothetical protein VKB42_04925 [Dongiaceae bacterium]|nr:hypothetical protein [Dongiaceae bacterium]
MEALHLGGMVLSGWLTDRMNRPLLLGAIYIVRGLAFILLIWAARDISLLFAFAVLFGLFDYSTVPVTASLAASHIGLRSLGLTMGSSRRAIPWAQRSAPSSQGCSMTWSRSISGSGSPPLAWRSWRAC